MDQIMDFAASPKVVLCCTIAFAVVMLILTVLWGASLFMEVTRKRASKLTVKYGNADDKSKEAGRLIVTGILILAGWIVFLVI